MENPKDDYIFNIFTPEEFIDICKNIYEKGEPLEKYNLKIGDVVRCYDEEGNKAIFSVADITDENVYLMGSTKYYSWL